MKLTIQHMRVIPIDDEEFESYGLSDGESFAPFGLEVDCINYKETWEREGKPLKEVLATIPLSECTPI